MRTGGDGLQLFDSGDFGTALADDPLDAAFERCVRHRATTTRADQLHVGDAVADADEPHVAAVAVNCGSNLLECALDTGFECGDGGQAHLPLTAAAPTTVARAEIHGAAA